MIKTILLSTLTFFGAQANTATDCKDIIIKTERLFRNTIKAEDFSSMTFTETGLTSFEFNALSETEQMKIYEKIKPVDMKSRETLSKVDSLREELIEAMREYTAHPEIFTLKQIQNILKLHDYTDKLRVELLTCI